MLLVVEIVVAVVVEVVHLVEVVEVLHLVVGSEETAHDGVQGGGVAAPLATPPHLERGEGTIRKWMMLQFYLSI